MCLFVGLPIRSLMLSINATWGKLTGDHDLTTLQDADGILGVPSAAKELSKGTRKL